MNKEEKIRVLLLVCNNVLNGTERYVVDLAKSLPKEKFEVEVATPETGPLSEILKKEHINEIVFNNGRLQKYSIKGLLNLLRIIKRNKYDVLHANAGILPCIIGRLRRIKLVLEVKHGIFYSKKQLDNMKIARKVYEISKTLFVHKFIATSENDKELMVKYFKIKRDKISVIYLGLDIESLKRKVAGIPIKEFSSQNILIGNIGRLTFQKGQDILLEAFRLLAEKHKGVRLRIVGEGEDKEMLLDFINKYKLNEIVTLAGYKQNIYEEMLNFDMHILTSRFEGMGYVNLEAMALGIPVITTNVGGATNFLENEYNSLITEVDDPLSSMKAMEKLIMDSGLKEELIANAKKTVADYNIKRMAEQTAEFYIRNLS